MAWPAGEAVDSGRFDVATAAEMQNVVKVPWISSFDIYYHLGVDGISLPLVVLTGFLFVLAMGASWSITKHVKPYCVLFLILETGVIEFFWRSTSSCSTCSGK